MSGEKGNSKADTLVKVVLVFFISLLSFSVGTFVGKQVSDSDHRRMALEGEYKGDRNVASTDKEEGTEPSDAKISEKEVENLTEEFVNKEKSREPADEGGAEAKPATVPSHEEATAEPAGKEGYKSYPRHAAGAEAPAAKAEAPKKADAGKEAKAEKTATHSKAAAMKPDATHKVAEKVVEGKAPTDGAKESRKPQSTLPSVASSAVGKFSVQVAAYATETEAKNHAAGLKEKGYNAFYLSRTESGKTWFRVLVGLFNTESSARQFRAQFMKEAHTKDAFVKKIVE